MPILISPMKKWSRSLLSKTVILGVDPGLKATGYGVIEVVWQPDRRIRLLEAGTINPKSRDSMPLRIDSVYKNLKDIIHQHAPHLMVLEKLFAHYKHPTTAFIMGHVRGAICLLCAHCQIELAEYSVKRIRKALVGNGSATKQQTQLAVAKVLSVDPSKLTLDASDALALALGHAYMQRL